MGVWLHFFDLRLFILDPRLHAGGSAVVECASRAIEDLVLQCQQKGVEVPSELCVWSDNTVKENKNQTVLSWMQWLVSRQKFKSCSLSCAITGHTHNALDQVYGLLATAFRYVTDLSDPHDVVQQISTLTGRLNLSAWLGADCRVTATYVKSIWNWRDWHLDTIRIIHPISHISNIQCFFLVLTLQPPCIFLWIRFISQSANFSRFKQLGVTFSGGLRTDASGNHSFIFLRRMGGFAAAFWYSLSSVNVKSNNVACFFDVNVKSNTVACFFD